MFLSLILGVHAQKGKEMQAGIGHAISRAMIPGKHSMPLAGIPVFPADCSPVVGELSSGLSVKTTVIQTTSALCKGVLHCSSPGHHPSTAHTSYCINPQQHICHPVYHFITV